MLGLSKQEEVLMDLLWELGYPMSSIDMLAKAPDAWGENSNKNIHRIIRQLISKELLEVCGQVASGTQYARLFRPAMTKEEYAVRQLDGFGDNSKIMIALGLTGAAKKKSKKNDEVDTALVEELEAMAHDFWECSEENDGKNENN